MEETRWGFPLSKIQAFEDAYVNWLAPAVRALFLMVGGNLSDGTNPKVRKADALAAEGYIIDTEIVVWGWEAYLVMYRRAGFQDVTKAAGLTVADRTRNVQLFVSTDPKDFPKHPEEVGKLDPGAAYVDKPYTPGQIYNGAKWFPTKQVAIDNLADGTETTYDGHTFRLHAKAPQNALQAAANEAAAAAGVKMYTWEQTSA